MDGLDLCFSAENVTVWPAWTAVDQPLAWRRLAYSFQKRFISSQFERLMVDTKR